MSAAADLRHALAELELIGPAARAEFLEHHAIASGGDWAHDTRTTWADGLYRCRVFGVFAEGRTLDELVAEWLKAARRVADDFDALAQAELIVGDLPPSICESALRRACATVRTQSRDSALIVRAESLCAVMNGAHAT